MGDNERQRLNSWKEISAFLNRSDKTARRWEVERQLPVHRVPGGSKSSVFAYVEELELWLAGPPDLEEVPIRKSRHATLARMISGSRSLWMDSIMGDLFLQDSG